MTNYNERLDVPAYQLHIYSLIKELGLSTNQKIEIANLMRNADNHDTLNKQIEQANRWAREQDDTK